MQSVILYSTFCKIFLVEIYIIVLGRRFFIEAPFFLSKKGECYDH